MDLIIHENEFNFSDRYILAKTKSSKNKKEFGIFIVKDICHSKAKNLKAYIPALQILHFISLERMREFIKSWTYPPSRYYLTAL